MIHDIVVAAAEHTATVELELESTCCNADGNWTLGACCSDKLGVIVGCELSVAIVECDRLNLGSIAGASPASVWVAGLSGDARRDRKSVV